MARYVSMLGLLVLLGLAYLLSNNKKRINFRILLWGVGLQLLFAIIILSSGAFSFAGMFIFMTLIVLFAFRDWINAPGERSGQIFNAGIVIGGTAVCAGLSYLLGQAGLLTPMIALLAAGLLLGKYVSRFVRSELVLTGFLGAGWAYLFMNDIDGRAVFGVLSEKVTGFLKLTDYGSSFLFGNIVDPKHIDTFGFQFAFGVLPTIIFFAAFMSILYHLGIMQAVVEVMAKFMRWTMGTSGAETLSCSANIFVGQTEAPLLIKPFLNGMTLSELLTVMVGGFATIAGGVLAGYIKMGVNPGHLIAASVMSAPAALVIGKIIYPETEHSDTAGDIRIPREKTTTNLLDAAAAGVTDGLKLAVNVGAMLVAFIALIALVDVILSFFDKLIDGNLLGGAYVQYEGASGFSPIKGEYAGYFPGSLKTLFGNLLRPLAWVMGVTWQDADKVGNLLGTKIALNEFVAFAQLSNYISAVDSGTLVMSERSLIISTYALCGFANFASIGIQIGGISAIAPSRRSDLAKVGLKAMIGGAFASWMTATIAGILI